MLPVLVLVSGSGLNDELCRRSLGGEVSHDGDFMIFEGNRYSRKGFLFKSFAMSAVVSPRRLVPVPARSTAGPGTGPYNSEFCCVCVRSQTE